MNIYNTIISFYISSNSRRKCGRRENKTNISLDILKTEEENSLPEIAYKNINMKKSR